MRTDGKLKFTRWASRLIQICGLSVLSAFVGVPTGLAQDGNRTAPRYELTGAYSYLRGNAGNYGASFNTNGFSGSGAYNLNPRLGVVGDFGFYKFQGLPTGLTSNMYTFMAGPRLTIRNHPKFQPYGQFLIGVGHLTARRSSINVDAAENGFAIAPGGGIDLVLKQRLGIRLFQFDFVHTNYDRSNGLGTNQNNWRITTGLIFRLGSLYQLEAPTSPSSPRVSCGADPATVQLEPGAAVHVWTGATAFDGGHLSYEWTASGGHVEGNGSDIRWSPPTAEPGVYAVSVRVADASGRATHCSSEITVVVRPNHQPVVACVADKHTAEAGQLVHVAATASDADNDPLTFSWKTTVRRAEEKGTEADFDTTGLAPGEYSFGGHVEDGHGGSADCAVAVTVFAPAPPALKHIEARLALRSIYFPTDLPSVQRPTAGLLASQQQTLLSIATDFKTYLESKPKAHLILQGHADERGADSYNQALSERRVRRVRAYLVEQGVPFDSVEILAYGYSRNLTAPEVKQLVESNGDLTEEDRQRMLANMRTIILANNRRVDIMLSTVLQQSDRKYPFKVEDALTLIREKPKTESRSPKSTTKPH